MNATALIDAAKDGILTGSVYALMATGLTLIFGVMDIINVAQGILVILGAYLSYALSVHLGIDLFLGLLITIPSLFVVGVVIERAFIGRLKGPEKTAMSILVTYAVSLLIEGALNIIFTVNDVQLHASYVNKSFLIGGIHFSFIYVAGFVMAVILFSSPAGVGASCLVISAAVIGVHSIMSGTAAADFGGRRPPQPPQALSMVLSISEADSNRSAWDI